MRPSTATPSELPVKACYLFAYPERRGILTGGNEEGWQDSRPGCCHHHSPYCSGPSVEVAEVVVL
jgi:hypothetical protein